MFAGQFCSRLKRMFLRNLEKRGMPAFIPNLVSTKHGRKFVKLSAFVLELWEMATWVLREGPLCCSDPKRACPDSEYFQTCSVFAFRFFGLLSKWTKQNTWFQMFPHLGELQFLRMPRMCRVLFQKLLYCCFQD